MKWVFCSVLSLTIAWVAADGGDFPIGLYNAFVKTTKDQNILVSPAATQHLLALLAIGAGGDTQTLLRAYLGMSHTTTPERATLRKALLSQAKSHLSSNDSNLVEEFFGKDLIARDYRTITGQMDANNNTAQLRTLRKGWTLDKLKFYIKNKVLSFIETDEKINKPNQIKPIKLSTNEKIAKYFGGIFANSDIFTVKLGVFVGEDYRVEARFNSLAVDYFNATVRNINFAQKRQAENEIINFAQQRGDATKLKIAPNDLKPSTKVVVVHRLDVHAHFEYPFDERATRREVFTDISSRQTKVRMMYQENRFMYANIEQWKARAVELPINGTDIRLLIILPNTLGGFSRLQKSISADPTETLTSISRTMRQETVQLLLPIFTVHTDRSVRSALEKMHLKNIFSKTANFSGLTTTDEEFAITNVYQKATIMVSEFGLANLEYLREDKPTRAKFDSIPVKFEVKRPFMYALKDSSQVYLMGHVSKI